MTKCRSSEFLGLIRGVLLDATNYYPNDQLEFERDLKRLESLSLRMGEATFLLHLPALDKLLLSSIEAGRLVRSGLPLTRPSSAKSMVPRLFRALWLRIFDLNGCLLQDIDPNALMMLRTLLCAHKKFVKECSPAVTFATVKEFYDVDESLPKPSLVWDGDGSDVSISDLGSVSDLLGTRTESQGDLPFEQPSLGRPLLDTVQRVADRISVLFGEFKPSEHRFRHGPGATAEFRRGTGYKYQFPGWSPRLQYVFPGEDYAVANSSFLGPDYDVSSVFPYRESCSRLIAVPKTQKAPRLIAAEPVCHQWCQQSVNSFLTDRIRTSTLGKSIDFRRQDLSQELVRTASLDRKLATIDLSSASDRLSTWLVQRLFRRNLSLLQALIACRTRFVSQAIDKKSPSLYKLRKFSTMGSALTFPVQSIAFYILCVAVGVSLHPRGERAWKECGKQVRVYGDDLIVPVSWVPRLKELFSSLFLKVNQQKTFTASFFRESCGLDAYRGSDVTPAYLTTLADEAALGSIAAVVATSNNFFRKGLWNAANAVESLVPPKMRNLIPVVQCGSGHFGFESYSGFQTASRLRWNKGLQIREYLTFAVKTTADQKSEHEGHANLLQYFTEDPARTIQEVIRGSVPREWKSGRFGVPTMSIVKRWVEVPYRSTGVSMSFL